MYQTRVISDESQVPAGYTRLKELGEKYSDSERKKLSDAHKNGLVRAVKIMRTVTDRTGATYVNSEDAEQYITSRRKREPQAVKDDGRDALIYEMRRIAEAQEKAVEILGRLEGIWSAS